MSLSPSSPRQAASAVSLVARLSDERRKLARLFEQSPRFLAVLDGPEHRIEFANRAYLEMIGEHNPIGLPARQALHEAAEQGFIDLLDHVYRTGETYRRDGALYFIRPDPLGPPRVLYVNLVLQPFHDDDGGITGVVVEGLDVTERTREQHRRDALERITQVIRETAEPAELAFRVAEIVGRLLGASRVGFSRIDPATDDLLTERDWTAEGVQSLAGTIPVRDYGVWVDDMKRGEITRIADVRQDPRTVDIQALEARHARSLLNIPVIEDGQLAAVFFVNRAEVHDWSDSEVAFVREAAERTRTATERLANEAARRRAAEALQAINDHLEQRIAERSAELLLYQNIVMSDAAPICAFDHECRLIAFNQAHSDEFFRIYGYRVKLGDVFPDLFLPEQGAIIRGFMERALTGESYVVTEEFGDPDLSKPAWEVAYNPLRDKAGNIVGAFHHATDISARLRAQAELATAQESLRQSQKMEAVGQLTGGLAHDFNNLLTGVMGNLELLQRKLARGRTEDIDRHITSAQGAGRRAAALTQRLLAFSRRQTLDPRPTDVNRLIAGMEDLIRRTMGPATTIEVVGAAGLWTAMIDATQLENAMLNLCINARDAMPDGGRLTIETANKWLDERTARERGMRPGQYLSLCVSDTGCGMSGDTIKRAFEPFFTTKPIGQGTGLGLSMVFGFAQQSGGESRIYSELGAGATVCIYLPRHLGEADVDEVETEHPATAGESQGHAVLLVDDEATIRHLGEEVLQELGCTVLAAGDGPSALRILQSGVRVQLLITDVGLPNGMNGRQVADAARTMRPGLKVLFITGYAENAAVGNGHLDPGMELLTKPFSIEAFATKVVRMLGSG